MPDIARGFINFCALTVLLLVTIGCGKGSPTMKEKPVVLVSVPPQAFFVERLAGDLVRVEILVPPGASPATYEPTIKQMQAVSEARLYITVGHPNFPFEKTWLSRLTENNPQLTLVSCNPADLKSGDPHIWVSPEIGLEMTEKIYAALVKLLPEHEMEMKKNRDELLEQITALDGELAAILKDQKGKKFMVFHPAWGHFAAHYGMEQIPIEEGMKEPSSATLSRLIEQARKEGIKVVFVQPQFPKEQAALVAREIGGKVVEADPLAKDWLENLRNMARQLKESREP